MKYKPIFVTGIGTGVGKTIVSAILTEYLEADYWKPVQAGDVDHSDSNTIKTLISCKDSVIHPERYVFTLAASPHKAAKQAGVDILLDDFNIPKTTNQLVIEGSGGIMVPLSNSLLMIDLILYFDSSALLVIKNYLGCINHCLLSYEMLKSFDIPITGIVINGYMDQDTYDAIRNYIPIDVPFWFVPELTEFSRESIHKAKSGFNGLSGHKL